MKPKATDLIVIATAKAKSGKEADLERALREVAGPTREQPGWVCTILLRSSEDRSTLVGLRALGVGLRIIIITSKALMCKDSSSVWPTSWPNRRASFPTKCSKGSGRYGMSIRSLLTALSFNAQMPS